MVAVDVL